MLLRRAKGLQKGRSFLDRNGTDLQDTSFFFSLLFSLVSKMSEFDSRARRVESAQEEEVSQG